MEIGSFWSPRAIFGILPFFVFARCCWVLNTGPSQQAIIAECTCSRVIGLSMKCSRTQLFSFRVFSLASSCTCSRRYVASGGLPQTPATNRQFSWRSGQQSVSNNSLQPRPLSMVLAQLSLATHATQQFHTQLFHIQLSHPHTISLPPSPRNSHTLSHTQLAHTQPSHKQLSHAQLSRTYLFHTICLPSSPVSFLPFPSSFHLSFATYWKKLTCGVIRSFNFELDMMKQSTHGA